MYQVKRNKESESTMVKKTLNLELLYFSFVHPYFYFIFPQRENFSLKSKKFKGSQNTYVTVQEFYCLSFFIYFLLSAFSFTTLNYMIIFVTKNSRPSEKYIMRHRVFSARETTKDIRNASYINPF